MGRCGLCGTTTHTTKPYWYAGMRLCKLCLQENLVSQTVLEERYCIRVFMPYLLQEGRCFSELIAGKVWYFKEHCAPRQRAEFSMDCLDTHHLLGKAARPIWLFWRPHLEKVLDMPKILDDAIHKQAAACVIRAHARRAITLRTLGVKPACSAIKRAMRPTYKVEWNGRSQAIRTALFTLRRMGITSPDAHIRSLPRGNIACISRIVANEDKMD